MTISGWDRRAELLRISVEALGRYRLRTALSTLGIVLGVAAVIAMLAVGEGAREEVLQQVEQLGSNNVIVRNQAFRRRFGTPPGGRRPAARLLPGVVAVSPLVQLRGMASGPLATYRTLLLGVTPAYAAVLDLEVERGRFLRSLDWRASGPVCVLGARLSRGLFGYRDPLGRQVQFDGRWCEVVECSPAALPVAKRVARPLRGTSTAYSSAPLAMSCP